MDRVVLQDPCVVLSMTWIYILYRKHETVSWQHDDDNSEKLQNKAFSDNLSFVGMPTQASATVINSAEPVPCFQVSYTQTTFLTT